MNTPNPIDLLFADMDKLSPGDDRLSLYVLRSLPEHRFEVVVDAGCGTGRQTFVLADELKTLVHAVDSYQPFLEDQKLASRIRYWRGFAQWRRAINGFNDAVDPKELARDLKTALDEFKAAIELDPKFVDAKVGIISSLGFLLFADRQDEARKKERIEQILATEKEASSMAPDNPRLIWVHGPILWNSPPERGGGQDKAIQNYQRGLEACSKIKTSDDPFEPSWGKPELMMSLAYSYLNAKSADLNAAERYARNALEIVPYWHYVRDILLPQIVVAKAKLP